MQTRTAERFRLSDVGRDARCRLPSVGLADEGDPAHHQFHRGLLFVLGLVAITFGGTAAHGGIKVGEAFPALTEFPLAQLGGGEVPVLSGNVVLVDFWASWCAPCKASFPALAKVHAEYAPRGLRIVAVSVDENAAAASAFRRKLNPPFVTLHDARQQLAERVGLPTMPTSYLVDRSGRVRYVHVGFRGEVDELRQHIEALLAEPVGSAPVAATSASLKRGGVRPAPRRLGGGGKPRPARVSGRRTSSVAPGLRTTSAERRSGARRRGPILLRLIVWCCVAGSALSGAGCATELARVQPWQRAALADYTMRPDRDPLDTAFLEHMTFSRETANGGRGVGGAGCGCN